MEAKSVLPSPELSAADQQLVDGVLAGQRRALAKTITLIESTREDHQQRAQQVLRKLLPHSGRAIRVGISGVPGAGKSTFIEALGVWLIENGHKLAVLAVDPSSSVSGGSILGDKTRMEQLCQCEGAFIRPSPSASACKSLPALPMVMNTSNGLPSSSLFIVMKAVPNGVLRLTVTPDSRFGRG